MNGSQLLKSAAKKPRINDPEEERSIAQKVGNVALGGISAIGNALDLVGSSVRDLAAFENPLDQWLSPFSPDNRTTGRDLLRKYGLVSSKDSISNFVPSMALEIATDPLTYLTFGASKMVGGGGKAAKAVGLLGDVEAVAAKKVTGATGRPIGRTEALMRTSLRDNLEHAIQRDFEGKVPNLNDVAKSETESGKAIRELDRYAKIQGTSREELLNRYGNEPLAGLAGVQVPFTNISMPIGTGRTALKVARHIDSSKAIIGKTAPARLAKALFHPQSGGAYKPMEQEMFQNFHRRAETEVQLARDKLFKTNEDLESVYQTVVREMGENAPSKTDISDLMWTTREFNGDLARAAEQHGLTGLADNPQIASAIESHSQRIRDSFDNSRQEVVNRGLDIRKREGTELLGYMPSTVVATAGLRSRLERARVLPRSMRNALARNPLRDNFPAAVATDIASNLYRKPELIAEKYGDLLDPLYGGIGSATSYEQLPKWLKNNRVPQEIREALKTHFDAIDWNPSRKLPPELMAAIAPIAKSRHARDLSLLRHQYPRSIQQIAKTIAEQTEQGVKSNLRIYDSPLATTEKYHVGAARMKAAADTTYDVFANNILKGQALETAQKAHTPQSPELFKLVGEDVDEAGNVIVPNAFSATNFNLPENAAKQYMAHTGIRPEAAEGLYVSKEAIDAANRLHENVRKSDAENILRTAAKFGTDVFRENVTLPFPAFHGRNLGGGMAGMSVAMSNLIRTPKDFSAFTKGIRLAYDMKNNPEKFAERMREIVQYDIPHYGFATGDVGTSADLVTKGSPFLPPDIKPSKATLGNYVEQASKHVGEDPTIGYVPTVAKDKLGGVAGFVDQGRKFHRTAVEYGGGVAANTEWFNRIGLYNYFRDHLGMSAGEAAKRVGELHIRYGNLTPFEKDYMRVAFPFYGFSKQIALESGKSIANRPGGPVASLIKIANRSRRPDELTPDYVAETTSIPLGKNEDGTARYITGFGMPWEDPLSFLGKGLRGAGLEVLSRANPLFKAPLEYSTGQSFFQSGPEGGRALGDMDPLLGRLASNVTGSEHPYKLPELVELAAANSPLSRYLTTARQLTDKRKDLLTKAVNALTGVRIADVSPAASEGIMRDRINSVLREAGAKNMAITYLPEYRKEQMTEQEIAYVNQLQAMLATLADRSRQRKKIAQEAAVNPT